MCSVRDSVIYTLGTQYFVFCIGSSTAAFMHVSKPTNLIVVMMIIIIFRFIFICYCFRLQHTEQTANCKNRSCARDGIPKQLQNGRRWVGGWCKKKKKHECLHSVEMHIKSIDITPFRLANAKLLPFDQQNDEIKMHYYLIQTST